MAGKSLADVVELELMLGVESVHELYSRCVAEPTIPYPRFGTVKAYYQAHQAHGLEWRMVLRDRARASKGYTGPRQEVKPKLKPLEAAIEREAKRIYQVEYQKARRRKEQLAHPANLEEYWCKQRGLPSPQPRFPVMKEIRDRLRQAGWRPPGM